MNARRQIIAALSEDSLGGIATLQDVAHAEQLVDAHRAEVLAEVANPADAATIYNVRPCGCDETPHPTWCPASVPTDERIAEIRDGVGDPLTARELSWLKGAAGRHALHVTGARGGHWPLTDDLPGALLLVSQYLAAAVAVIERAGLAEEATAAAATATPDETFFVPRRVYTRTNRLGLHLTFVCEHLTKDPKVGDREAWGWLHRSDGTRRMDRMWDHDYPRWTEAGEGRG
ncbi:hypothetical protein PV355_01800 [Streptomyces stelliscabiei]|uniref:hypothetical protein n=1 Tax=Streptomyces stelliscabiei TaxID=146820 RepID=UPI0029A0BF89|nr:hypothetical protein [Streptomyces stelliscabiei]MDX2513901.1 hypothetical protein [Streptomyces stelliscabiei]